MKSTKFWLIALGLLAFLAVATLFLLPHLRDPGEVVELIQDGTLLHTLPLSEDKTLRIMSKDGKGYNFISIKNGTVSVTEASCADKVCVKHPAIYETGNPIVCLPNRLTIQVIGGSAGALDGVVG